jgi:hypothetical protein
MSNGTGSAYPHVASLTYPIGTDEVHRYEDRAELRDRIGNFSLHLRDGRAEFTPLVHFANEADARSELEPRLRAWEVHVALTHGTGVLHFSFRQCRIQQSAPPPGVIEVPGAAMVMASASVQTTVSYAMYHAPPHDFAVDQTVRILADLFLLARAHPVMLLYIAYSMTTFLEDSFGDFARAAKRLGISQNVFQRIDNLANTRGTGAEVRKFKRGVKRSPLTFDERGWLIRVLELIVRRSAAATAGARIVEQATLKTTQAP